MNKIKGLNGIRALAALSVVFTHLGIFTYLIENEIISSSVANSINGGAGVQAFFVLSGFLITYLLIYEYESKGSVSLYNFYIRRSLRIFPLYFFILFLISVVQLSGAHIANPKSILYAIFYSYNFIPKDWYSAILGHTWSLAVEEHFYLIWPFVFISFVPKFQKMAMILMSFIFISLFVFLYLDSFQWLKDGYFIERWSFISGSSIAMGVLLAILISRKNKKGNIANILGTYKALILSFLLVFSEIWFKDVSYIISQYIRGIGFSVFIGWIVLNQNKKITTLLEIEPLNYLGKISYGIYMYQGFFLSTGPHRTVDQLWPPSPHYGILFLVIAAPLSYHYFEKPIINMKLKFQH